MQHKTDSQFGIIERQMKKKKKQNPEKLGTNRNRTHRYYSLLTKSIKTISINQSSINHHHEVRQQGVDGDTSSSWFVYYDPSKVKVSEWNKRSTCFWLVLLLSCKMKDIYFKGKLKEVTYKMGQKGLISDSKFYSRDKVSRIFNTRYISFWLSTQNGTQENSTCGALRQLWPCSHHKQEQKYHSPGKQDNPKLPFGMSDSGKT